MVMNRNQLQYDAVPHKEGVTVSQEYFYRVIAPEFDIIETDRRRRREKGVRYKCPVRICQAVSRC
ncbi:hypothetical protein PSP6_620009 [Paraburkholderia tropica]|nr:hypothetical protein PSP6_620009 [Paraburkholderia tropica]